MNAPKEIMLQEANRRAEADPALATSLGLIMLMGMVEVEAMEAFAGTDLRHNYVTHFPMSDVDFWEFTIARKAA